jgi:hypothetical protein
LVQFHDEWDVRLRPQRYLEFSLFCLDFSDIEIIFIAEPLLDMAALPVLESCDLHYGSGVLFPLLSDYRCGLGRGQTVMEKVVPQLDLGHTVVAQLDE